MEGKNVARAFDLMLHNNKNTPPVPVIQPPIIIIPGLMIEDEAEKGEADIGLFDRNE